MNQTIAGSLALSLFLGCAAPDPDGDAREASSSSPPDFVAATAEGDLVIASGASGMVRDTALVQGRVADAAWDPWTKRVIVVDQDDGDEGGEIAAYAVRDGRFGARAHIAWLDGRAKILPSPYGPIVFEQSYGERWKLLGGKPAPSVIAPPPISAWITTRASGAVVHGFGLGAGGYERRCATVSAAGLAMAEVEAIPAAPLADARLVHAPARGGDVLVGIQGASLAVKLVGGAGMGPTSLVPLPSAEARIEAAAALGGGAIVVLLLAHPTAIEAVALADDGAVSSSAGISIPGDIAEAAPFFSRDLAVMGDDRVVAGTSAGLFAALLTHGSSGIHLDLAPGFDGAQIRGPIATLSSP